MNLKDIYFFEEVTSLQDSRILINENKGDFLAIQVVCNGTFDITVQGCMNLENDVFKNIAATNMNTLESSSTITTAGLYHLDVGGYRKVRLVLNSIGSSPLTAYGMLKDRKEIIKNGGGDLDPDNYYNKSEIDSMISAITTMDLRVVQELPTQDISTTTIYLVPKSTSETNNYYDEYIYVQNNWEFIGSTEVDLTDYVKNTDYANDSVGGVIKTSSAFATQTSNGNLLCRARTYEQYNSSSDNSFIGKATLENVITGKGLVSNTDYSTNDTGGVIKTGNGLNVNSSGIPSASSWNYTQYSGATDVSFISKGTLENVLNARIGDISSVLDTINGESI